MCTHTHTHTHDCTSNWSRFITLEIVKLVFVWPEIDEYMTT